MQININEFQVTSHTIDSILSASCIPKVSLPVCKDIQITEFCVNQRTQKV